RDGAVRHGGVLPDPAAGVRGQSGSEVIPAPIPTRGRPAAPPRLSPIPSPERSTGDGIGSFWLLAFVRETAGSGSARTGRARRGPGSARGPGPLRRRGSGWR